MLCHTAHYYRRASATPRKASDDVARHATPTQRQQLITRWRAYLAARTPSPAPISAGEPPLPALEPQVDDPAVLAEPRVDDTAILPFVAHAPAAPATICWCGHEETSHASGECWETRDGAQCKCDFYMPKDMTARLAYLDTAPSEPAQIHLDYPDGSRIPVDCAYGGPDGHAHRWVAIVPRSAELVNGMVIRVRRDTVLAVALADSAHRLSEPIPVPS